MNISGILQSMRSSALASLPIAPMKARNTINYRPSNRPHPHHWVSEKSAQRHLEVARRCAETMDVGDEMALGRVHDMYREMFGIRTKNPWWYTTYLVRSQARDRRRWWIEYQKFVKRSDLREYQVFEIVSFRKNVNWPEGARTTRVRYVGPDPELWLPQPPEGLLPPRDFR